jgi:hypothetical protein
MHGTVTASTLYAKIWINGTGTTLLHLALDIINKKGWHGHAADTAGESLHPTRAKITGN